MRFKHKLKRVISAIMASVIAFGAVNVMPVTAAPSVTCSRGMENEHEYLGAEYRWTYFADTTGELFGWPRKNYFVGGEKKIPSEEGILSVFAYILRPFFFVFSCSSGSSMAGVLSLPWSMSRMALSSVRRACFSLSSSS